MHRHGRQPEAHTHFRAGAQDWQRLVREQEERIPLADRWWNLLGKPVGRRLADVGCGPGVLSLHYAELGADVLAVDLRSDALAHVPRHPRLRTLAHDLEAAPLPQRVEVLVVTDVLHHAAKPEALLRNARASGDRILVGDHDVGQYRGPPQDARMAPDRVAGMLRQAGFEPQPTTLVAPGQYAVIAD